MESLSSIGIMSSEASGKSTEELFEEYSKNYNMIRRQAAEPSYIIIGIDYGVTNARKKVVIGDWR